MISPDSAILIHDCGRQQLYIATAEGNNVQLAANWDEEFKPSTSFKAYYDRRTVVAAGIAIADGTVRLRVIGNVTLFDSNLSVGIDSDVELAIIPRTAYSVWDDDGTRHSSYDTSGMQPRAVLRDACPSTFRSMQRCYVVYMERPSSMDFMRAYIPENGGIDMEIYSYSSALMDNALGHPLRRQFNNNLYTLRGTCFQMENRVITDDGKAPPIVTLGNACKQAPRLGIKCATPLNNPFITDVMTSPILLPDGLSATHTQMELEQIFSTTCNQTDFFSGAPSLRDLPSGPRLYQSVLRSVHATTLPVDFVELGGGIADVVYVTPTTVGLISTKRILLFDYSQDGYVKATKLISCPPGFFGTVGDVCRPCESTPAQTPAYQIQCRDGKTFETFTIVASKSVDIEDVRQGICIFTSAKNVSCSTDVSMAAQPQPLNMAADAAEGGGETLSIVKCMVLTAEKISGRPLFRLDNIAEYSSRIISTGRHILGAAASRTMQFDTYNTTDDANTARGCANTLVKGVGSFLQCAVPRVVGARRRRRLLSEPLAAVWEQHGPSMASRTRVLNTPPPAPSPPPAPRAATSAAGVDVALIAGIVVAVTAALVICVLLVARRRRTTQYARLQTADATAAGLTHFLAADRHDELVHQPPSPRQYIVLRHGRPRSLGRKNEA